MICIRVASLCNTQKDALVEVGICYIAVCMYIPVEFHFCKAQSHDGAIVLFGTKVNDITVKEYALDVDVGDCFARNSDICLTIDAGDVGACLGIVFKACSEDAD